MKLAALTVLLSVSAYAQCPFAEFRESRRDGGPDGGALDESMFSYLNGIDADPERGWELMTETAYGVRRVFTERIEIALAVPVPRMSLTFVTRIGAGFDANFDTADHAIQGLTLALGVRHISVRGHFVLEAGLRFIPPWYGPSDRQPSAQSLALAATLTGNAADDARWLPISTLGVQFYLEFQTRSRMWGNDAAGWWVMGARYGGQGSLAPVGVHTWLGSQPQFLADVFLEPFFAFAQIGSWITRLTVGGHVDLSLSSIWPAEVPFPLVLDLFVAWSPRNAHWLSLRVFGGWSGSLAKSELGGLQYGLRLQFWVP